MISRRLVIAVPILLACAGCVNHTPAVKQVAPPVVAANPTPVRMAPVPTADWKAMVAPEPTSRLTVEPTKVPVKFGAHARGLATGEIQITGKFLITPREKAYLAKVHGWWDILAKALDQPDDTPGWQFKLNVRLAVDRIQVEQALALVPPDFEKYNKIFAEMLDDLHKASDSDISMEETSAKIDEAQKENNALTEELTQIKNRWSKIPSRIQP